MRLLDSVTLSGYRLSSEIFGGGVLLWVVFVAPASKTIQLLKAVSRGWLWHNGGLSGMSIGSARLLDPAVRLYAASSSRTL